MKVKRIDGLHLPHRDGDPMTNFLQENEGLAFNVDHAQMDGLKKLTQVHEKLCKKYKQ